MSGIVSGSQIDNSGIVGGYPTGHVIQFTSVTDTQNLQSYNEGSEAYSSASCTLSNCVAGNFIVIHINNGTMAGANQGGTIGIQINDGGSNASIRVTAEEHGGDEKMPASCSWVHTVGTSGTIIVKRMCAGVNDGHYMKWEMAPTASFLTTYGPTSGKWGIMEIQA